MLHLQLALPLEEERTPCRSHLACCRICLVNRMMRGEPVGLKSCPRHFWLGYQRVLWAWGKSPSPGKCSLIWSWESSCLGWNPIFISFFSFHVTLGKLLSLSVPRFPICRTEIIPVHSSGSCWSGCRWDETYNTQPALPTVPGRE